MIENLNNLFKKEEKLALHNLDHASMHCLFNNTIHGLFEEQVAKTPNAIAVIYKDSMLTYSELDTRANQLAHYIKSIIKINRDDIILLCLDRSEFMLVKFMYEQKVNNINEAEYEI